MSSLKQTKEWKEGAAEVERLIKAAVDPLKKKITALENEVGAQADRIKNLEGRLQSQ